MAKSYYGYVERDVKNYTDWSEVSKTISDSLDKEAADRAKIKADLDKQLDTDLTNLANAPQSEHAGIVEQTAAYTDGATTLMLGLDRDFKAGKVKYSDYVARTNNLRNDTAIVYSKQKELDAQYKEIQERAKSVDGGMSQGAYQEQWQAAQLQSYLDPANTSLMIDPNTFRVNVAKKKINPTTGVVEYGDYQPVSSLYTRLNQKVNNFSMDKLKNDMGGLGQVIESIRLRGGPNSSGQILSVEDVLQRKEGKDALDNYVDAQMSPDNKSSILTNWIRVNPKTGKAFDFTQDPEEAAKDPNKVLLVLDPENLSSGKLVAKPTKEQDALVKEWLTQQAKAQLKHVEKSDIYTEQTETATERESRNKAAQGKKEFDFNVGMIAQLYEAKEGSPVITSASRHFTGLIPNLEKLTRTDEGVVLTMKNGEQQTIPFYSADGKPMSKYDFIRSATQLTGEGDINDAIKKAAAGKNSLTPTKTGIAIESKKTAAGLPMTQQKTDIMSDKSQTIYDKAKTDITEASKKSEGDKMDNIVNAVEGVLAYLPDEKEKRIQSFYQKDKGYYLFQIPTDENPNQSFKLRIYEGSSPDDILKSLQTFYDRINSSGAQTLTKPSGSSGGASTTTSTPSMGNSANALNNLIGK